MAFEPIKEAFNAGEIGRSFRGRVSSEVYKRGLDLCDNFEILPEGSIRKRAGSVLVDSALGPARLVRFRETATAEDYMLALAGGKLRAYGPAGRVAGIHSNLITNGYFDANWNGWTLTYSGQVAVEAGYAKFTIDNFNNVGLKQTVNVVAGHTLRLSLKLRLISTTTWVQAQILVDGVVVASPFLTSATQIITHEFVAPVGGTTEIHVFMGTASNSVGSLDDVVLYDTQGATVDELNIPWTDDQLDRVQVGEDVAHNALVFIHPEVAPQILRFIPEGNVWVIYPAVFVNSPGWGDAAWPGAIEFGFQGRMWLGGTEAEPGRMWASKTGSMFDFTTGATEDASASWTLSAKGRIMWLQGQKSLLAGVETVEESAVGVSGGLISGAGINARDESAFGSAPVQAVHVGDEVAFVSRDRKHLRTLGYSLERNGWVARALTFTASHLVKGRIREVAFAQSPYPAFFLPLLDGTLRVCTYDRGEEVLGWGRFTLPGATINHAATAEVDDGGEVWISTTRGGAYYIEKIPLHEVGRAYLDVPRTAIAAGGAVIFIGIGHLEGETVTALVNGVVFATDLVVQGGAVAIPGDIEDGAEVTIGIPYIAKAITLPLNPKSGKVGVSKIGVLLEESAFPKFNGRWRPADRSPATLQGNPEPLRSGKFEVGNATTDAEGKITIEADLPARCEVLALYAVVQ